MYILIESLIFQDEYAEALAVIERSILATDLALHFRDAQALSKLATSISQCPKKLDALITEENSQSKHLMQAGMMTAADLGNATKVKEILLQCCSKACATPILVMGLIEFHYVMGFS